MIIRILGDTHGNVDSINNAIDAFRAGKIDAIWHVGDIGFGFDKAIDAKLTYLMESMKDLGCVFNFVRGNHDNPHDEFLNSFITPSGSIAHSFFAVNGAMSIDKHKRIEGIDWWREEEHTIPEFIEIGEKFINCCPRNVISHDCPQNVAEIMFPNVSYEKMRQPSRTRNMLQCFFDEAKVKPKLWLFGHWHVNRITTYKCCTFICVGKNTFIDLALDYKQMENTNV